MFSSNVKRSGTLLILIVLFEVFLGRFLEFNLIRPDLFLVLIVFWAFCVDRQSAIQISLILGLLRDVFSTGYFGIATLSYFVIGCIISFLSLKLQKHSLLMRSSILFLFSFANLSLLFILETVLMEQKVIASEVWVSFFWSSAYTALLGGLLVSFLEKRAANRVDDFSYSL